MTKITYTNIASVAEKPTDATGVVAMVNVEIASTARIIRSADSAPATLTGEHLFVGAYGKAVGLLKSMVSTAARIVFAPFAGVLRCSGQVLSTPLRVSICSAGLAVNGITVPRSARFEEFRKLFRLLALRAALEARRKVESVSRHVINYTSDLSLLQGAI